MEEELKQGSCLTPFSAPVEPKCERVKILDSTW